MKFLHLPKYILIALVVVGAGLSVALAPSPSSVSAAPSKADCSNTKKTKASDKADCQKEYDKCGTASRNPDTQDNCREAVLYKYSIASAGTREACADTSDAEACRKDFDKCAESIIDKHSGVGGVKACQDDALAKYAKPTTPEGLNFNDGKSAGTYYCGNGKNKVKVKFNLGCLGTNYTGGTLGPIEDMLFAFLRFLSIGVGVAVIIAIIAAGIRYSTSQGNAEVTQSAKNNIQNAVIALIIYIFAFSILQYLVPGGIFKPGIWLAPDSAALLERMLP